jgi:hypothetical protein
MLTFANNRYEGQLTPCDFKDSPPIYRAAHPLYKTARHPPLGQVFNLPYRALPGLLSCPSAPFLPLLLPISKFFRKSTHKTVLLAGRSQNL